MAVDKTPSQVATSALQAIPFGSIIGGPLKACVEAQALASSSVQMAAEIWSAPAPPYSAGTVMPMMPN